LLLLALHLRLKLRARRVQREAASSDDEPGRPPRAPAPLGVVDPALAAFIEVRARPPRARRGRWSRCTHRGGPVFDGFS